jgi:hypothetical protein
LQAKALHGAANNERFQLQFSPDLQSPYVTAGLTLSMLVAIMRLLGSAGAEVAFVRPEKEEQSDWFV